MTVSSISYAEVCGIEWKDMGPTPGSEVKAKPQGLTFIQDFGPPVLLFSNHYETADEKVKGNGSTVYMISPSDLPLTTQKNSKLKQFSFPKTYQHISGLSADENNLYAVDYRTNKIITLDPVESFKSKVAHITKVQSTGVNGSSAAKNFVFNGQELLALSDFSLWNGTTQPTKILNFGECKLGTEICSYKSGGRSQGLTYAILEGRPVLLESVNMGIMELVSLKMGTPDRIFVHDLQKLIDEPENEKATYELNAPGVMVEDLTWNFYTNKIYTSDEGTYRIYEGTFIIKKECKKKFHSRFATIYG